MTSPTFTAPTTGATITDPYTGMRRGGASRTGTTTTTTPAPVGADTSAVAFIREYMHQVFGGALDAYAEQAWERYNSGVPLEQILFDLRQTPAYAARFPGMAGLRDAGRPISEAAYLDLERTYTQVARGFDLPPGFYDSPDDFGRLIGNEVSPAEYQRRLTDWQAAERESRDPTAAAEIARQFADAGYAPPTEGDWLATFIDPTRAVSALERRQEAARIGTESIRAGFGQLGVTEAGLLADQGVTQDQARQGFGTLADSQQLFTPLPGSADETFSRTQQTGAVFGTDAASARRIEQQRRKRQAEFGGGGGSSLGRDGLSGLGSAG